MSIDATRWAWQQADLKSSTKLVLLALADRADEHHRCFPSVRRLEVDTCLNRKTILTCLAALEDAGLLRVDRRHGAGSIYVLVGVPSREFNGMPARLPRTQKGLGITVEHSRETCTENGTSTENGTGPLAPPPGTENGTTTSTENGTATSTENGTGIYQGNLSRESNNNRPHSQRGRELPDWLDRTAWNNWRAHRRTIRSPMTDRAEELQIARLAKLRDEGHDPVSIIDLAIEKGWENLHPPFGDDRQRGGARAQASAQDSRAPTWQALGFPTFEAWQDSMLSRPPEFLQGTSERVAS